MVGYTARTPPAHTVRIPSAHTRAHPEQSFKVLKCLNFQGRATGGYPGPFSFVKKIQFYIEISNGNPKQMVGEQIRQMRMEPRPTGQTLTYRARFPDDARSARQQTPSN